MRTRCPPPDHTRPAGEITELISRGQEAATHEITMIVAKPREEAKTPVGNVCPGIFSLKFGVDVFQNLKIEIMKNCRINFEK